MSPDKAKATRWADALMDGDYSNAPELAALLRRWPDGEPVASMIRHRAGTPASRAWDGKVHWHEWSEWSPATLAHGRAVTDPSRNHTEDSEWQMQPLYAAQPDQSARIADRKWLDNECLDGGCQSLKWHERIAALEAENANLVRGLREATEPPTFMGEPVPDARIAALARLAAYQEAREVAWEAELKDSQSVAEHWKAKHAAENARIAALEADRAAALRLANDLTLETQTVEEAVADLVRMVRDARTRIAALEASLAERDRVIEQARVALERIRHATAPTHDDGGHHEAAHDLSIDALRAIEEVRK